MSEKEMESLQHKARRLDRVAIVISVAAFFILVFLLFWLTWEGRGQVGVSDLPDLAIAMLLIPMLLAVGCYMLLYLVMVQGAYERFNRAFKETCVLQTIREIAGFEDLHYTPQKGFPFNEVWDSCVVATGDPKYYKSEDLLTGTYRGMDFSYCDVITKYLKRSKGKNREVTLFHGQIMRFSLPEGAKWSFGHLQIFEREFLSDIKGRTAGHEIQMEHEAFNQRFQVFAEDEHNAFYVLTPQMLESIVQFANAADSQIAVTFVGTSLYVAVNNSHSMFDASMKDPLAEQRKAVRAEAELMRRAGELLGLEKGNFSHLGRN